MHSTPCGWADSGLVWAGQWRRSLALGRRIRPRRVLCLLALPLLVAACGGDDDPPPTPTVQPTATTPAAPAEVLAVVWAARVTADTNAPEVPVEQLTVDAETIYAVVRVTNLPAGAVLSAAWTYNGVPVEPASSTVTAAAPISDGYVEFHLSRDPGAVWPDGTYAVAISLDGQVRQTAEIAVVEPE